MISEIGSWKCDADRWLIPMTLDIPDNPVSRRIYIVLSPRSLAYSRYGLQTLLLQSLEQLDIVLITDSRADREELIAATGGLKNPQKHLIKIFVMEELADLEASFFARQPNLRSFRHGHPCWRKITDPLLIAGPAEELVSLDPDLYFPNRFSFEQTSFQGVLLMWQKPNCLLPPEVVLAAMGNGVRLARHVDIGVAHWRSSPDLDWLDWMLDKLGAPALPQVMHVEAIVWAAIAMREGGGYLDARYWRCWRRTPVKRVIRKLGASGRRVLQSEPWRSIKCFHAGGEAKWWLAEMEQHGVPTGATRTEPGIVRPFKELTSERFAQEQRLKRVVHGLDYFQLLR